MGFGRASRIVGKRTRRPKQSHGNRRTSHDGGRFADREAFATADTLRTGNPPGTCLVVVRHRSPGAIRYAAGVFGYIPSRDREGAGTIERRSLANRSLTLEIASRRQGLAVAAR